MKTATVDGDALRRAREERGLTLEALAESIGCHLSMLSLIETGKRQPGGALFNRICVALGVPREDLLVKEAA